MAELDWKRVRELFDAAAELAPAERAILLARDCADDAVLRSEVERLLRAHDQAAGFIEQPALALFDSSIAAIADKPTKELTMEMAGQRIGQYQVLRELGRGGMGVVYLAVRADGEFRKQVAIKLLPPGADAGEIHRFRRERQILADLDHPNIARLIDGGTLNGRPYVVMEFVEGQSLRELLREQTTLPPDQVLAIARQVCDGLAAAHALGIVHRDIKPENLIVAEHDGSLRAKILDFGIAKLQQAQGSDTTTIKTYTGRIIGTVSYMSPEQAAGAGGEEIDARSDIYSFGMVIYEMLVGQPAFTGDSYLSVLYKHQHVQPTPPHEMPAGLHIPRAVSQVILKALAKDRARRQRSARQLAEELAEALRDGKARKPASQWRNVALIAAAASLALVLGMWALVAWSKRPAAVTSPVAMQAATVAANALPQLQYRVFKKSGANPEAVMLSPLGENIVRPDDSIQFEFTLPFAGRCYLFFEGRDGKLVWLNPRPGKSPQRARGGEPLRVPENIWLPFEKDDPRNQIFIVVYVPDGTPWSLEDVVPAEEQEEQLKVAAQKGNFPYAQIRQPFAARLIEALEKKARPVDFAGWPVDGRYLADLPPADGRRLISHKIELWHRLK